MASPRHTRRPAHRLHAPRRWVLAPLRVLVALVLAFATLPFIAAGTAQAAVPTSIVVDGNQDGATNDWEGYAEGDAGFSVIRDGVGAGDTTILKGAEGNPPWDPAGSGSPAGKSDIGNVLVASYRNADDDLIGVIGFDRGFGKGTGRYYFELNQAQHNSVNPPRTIGDVRVIVGINGSDLEECQGAQLWTGSGWGAVQSCPGFITFSVNTETIADNFGSPFDDVDGNLPTNQFMELSVNLSKLGATTCPVAGFRTFDMRTQEGGENGDTSRLKDYTAGPVSIPSDCGSIVINKLVAGVAGSVGAGATFQITSVPASDGFSQIVTTGSDGTVTVTDVKPGSYTVTELAPPSGALLPAGAAATKSVTVPKGLPGTATFDDPYGSGSWTKGYDGTDPTGSGATFAVVRTKKWTYDITPDQQGSFAAPVLEDIANDSGFAVTDNVGSATTARSPTPTATWGTSPSPACRAVAGASPRRPPPRAGRVDPDTECFTVGPTTAEANGAAAGSPTFNDPLKKVTLRVDKTESSPGIDGTKPLDGVTFNLYADVAGAPGATPIDTQVTGPQGHASFAGLDWQKSYWLEEVALDGYRIGLNPNPKPISFTSSDGGTTVADRGRQPAQGVVDQAQQARRHHPGQAGRRQLRALA